MKNGLVSRGDVFREKRVLRRVRVHVDHLALSGVLVQDPQVVLGDGGMLSVLKVLSAFQDSVSLSPWDIEDPCLLQRLKHRHDISTCIYT